MASDRADTVTRQAVPPELSGKEARDLFGAMPFASSQPSQPFGSYAKGCISGAVQLPETGPGWQAMRLSRNRNWGHPELVDYLEKLAGQAAQLPGWNGIYIGDLSQPRGGPMRSGHASHQMGLDADIWMLPGGNMSLSRPDRERISTISVARNRNTAVNGNWTPQYTELLKAAASDPRVERIFLFPGGKVQMCKTATGDRSWLRKIRPWYGHDDHFHVRLACPRGMSGCTPQNPPPPGDGCDEAQTWVNNILNPPPPKPRDPNAPPPKPKRQLTLADLPAQCVSVLQSR
nr:penicillin-insensitive murein endopeptidase [Pseudooceanicola sediminis]